MQRSSLHIIIAILLAVLYIGERAVPCMEVCVDECASECSGAIAGECGDCSDECASECAAGCTGACMNEHEAGPHVAADHHDDEHDPLDQTHHCGHCACPCHIPALSTQGDRFLSAIDPGVEYGTIIARLRSVPVHPPDHIPLA